MHSINDACLIARVTFEDNLEVHLGCGGNTSTSSLPSHLLPSSPLLTHPHPDLPSSPTLISPDLPSTHVQVHRLWRYLNMLHAAAYCGLTDELTEGNFLYALTSRLLGLRTSMAALLRLLRRRLRRLQLHPSLPPDKPNIPLPPLSPRSSFPACDKFGLLSQGEVQDEELAAINRIRIDDSGSRACSMFEVCSSRLPHTVHCLPHTVHCLPHIVHLLPHMPHT